MRAEFPGRMDPFLLLARTAAPTRVTGCTAAPTTVGGCYQAA